MNLLKAFFLIGYLYCKDYQNLRIVFREAGNKLVFNFWKHRGIQTILKPSAVQLQSQIYIMYQVSLDSLFHT